MAEEIKKYTDEEAHKKFGVEFFNKTWEFIEKKDRTAEENEEMITLALASNHHWSFVGKPIHFQRGEWLVSLAYAMTGRGEQALLHARKCLELTEKHGKEKEFQDFDHAFAFEAMARASKTAKKDAEYKKYNALAKEAGEKIKEKGDREWFFKCMNGIATGGIEGL